ncbi:MAG: hypothetical protein CL424_14560 [Acidimicrobiaceae bacterium]|nr:hypothetical protein [Acidimicrobiaceae bacterium]
MTDLAHGTVVVDRHYPHPPTAVFAAYSDIEQRSAWSAPSDAEELVFDSHDFRIGGADEFRCGLKGNLVFAGTTRYEQIVDGSLIVFTETVSMNGDLRAVSLVTWHVEADGDGSKLTITDQVTSFGGPDEIEGHRAGYTGILDQLDRFLSTSR